MKKVVCFILSVVMLLSTTAKVDFSAYALSSEDFEFAILDDGTAQIIDYSGLKKEVTIPYYVTNGPGSYYKVTRIGNSAFQWERTVTSITIPGSVESIGQDTFNWCDSLERIDVDTNNLNFSSIDGVLFNKELTNLIRYPEGKTDTTYNIPNGVTSIAQAAFQNYPGTGKLTSITIPASLTNMDDVVLAGGHSLERIDVDANNLNFSSIDGVLFNKEQTNLIRYPDGKTENIYNIPNSVTSIGKLAFCDCRYLTNITIPDSVTSIGSSAFKNCSSLEKITIPNSVMSIGDHAFTDCIGLTDITIPNSVTSIGERAFDRCSGLVTITIPNSVTNIKKETFFYCSNLTSITIPNSVTYIESDVFIGCDKLKNVLYLGTEENWNKISIMSNDELKYVTIHYFDANITKSATCIDTGIITYTSSTCSEIFTETIPATGHIEVIDDAVAPTCTKAGLTQGSHCSSCHKIIIPQQIIPATGHTKIVIDKAIASTCTESGLTEGSHCSICNEIITEQKLIPALGHHFIEDIQDGGHTKTVTCSNEFEGPCRIKLSKELYPESNHPYRNNENKTYFFSYPNATEYIVKFSDLTELESNFDYVYIYNSDGNLVGKYTGTQLKSKEIIIKSNNFRIILTSDSSQTKYGFSIDKIVATVQDSKFKCDYYEKIKTDHDYQVTDFRSATCYNDGYNTYQCTICGDTYTEYVFSEGHNYVDEVVYPTCTENGYTIHTCSVCGDSYIDNKISASGHSFSKWTYNDDAEFISSSNFKNGTQTRGCSVCGAEETVEAPNTALLRRRGNALALESSITLTTYITKDIVDYYDEVYAEFTRNGKTETVYASDKTFKSGSTVYNIFDYAGISPQAMGDDIEIKFYGIKDGVKYWGETYTYSVTAYVTSTLSKSTTSAKLKTMLVDLMYYGEACQIYQNYKTDSLMTNILTDEQKQLRSTGELNLTSIKDSSYATCENRLVRFGTALRLNNAVEIAIPLNMTNVTLEELTFNVKIGSRDLTYTYSDNPENFEKGKDGYWYFYFDRVYANQMSDEVFITAYRGDEQVSYTLKYSVESYAATVTDSKLKKVTDAMMRYGNSAKAYSGK